MSPSVTVVVALPSEAQPVISHYRLQATDDTPFRIYRNDTLRLIVSGMGCEASAAAVGFAAGIDRSQPKRHIWLNLGIAGHRDLALGSVRLAGSVSRSGNPKRWYPGLSFSSDLYVSDVVSYDAPVDEYLADTCHEMEAHGFVSAANRVGCIDLVQICKVISDNRQHHLEQISRSLIAELIGDALPAFDDLIAGLRECAESALSISAHPLLDGLLERVRTTHSQRKQLSELLDRCAVLGLDAETLADSVRPCTDINQVLNALNISLDACRPRFNHD